MSSSTSDPSLINKIVVRFGELLFNMFVTHVPSHFVRLGVLRALGAEIGPKTWILRGTTILGITNLVVGKHCNIGFRCMIDARAKITIGDYVVIASDTHFITGTHDVYDPGFAAIFKPITVHDCAWIASRATVLCGVDIGHGAVVAACSLVKDDVPAMDIVAGLPAKKVGERTAELRYESSWRPLFY